MLLALQETAGYICQSNKHEVQITYYSHSNSKPVETAENCCYVNIENAGLRCKTWCSLVKRWFRDFVEPSAAEDIWRVEKE